MVCGRDGVLTLTAPGIVGATMEKGVFNGSGLVDATLDEPVLHQPTINGGVLSKTATVDATHRNSTFQGETSIEGNVDLTGNRITGAADAAEDTDVMNLRSTRAMIEEFVAGMDLPAISASAEPLDTSAKKQVISPVLSLDITALSAAGMTMGEPVEEEQELLTQVETSFDIDYFPKGDLHIEGDLTLSGSIMNVPAMFRPTPSADTSLGLLDGADATSALSDIAAMVYNLPDGGLAMGIDPGTIPAEMSFVMKAGVGADGAKNKSIDYVQLIAPITAALQAMAVRITELEAQIDAAH